MKNYNIAVSIISIVLALVLWHSCNKQKELQDYKSLYEFSQDTLSKTIDKLGRETTTTALLYGQCKDFKHLINKQDSTLKKLQKLVNKNTISATILNNSTKNKIVVHDTVYAKDSVVKGNKVYLYPEYRSSFSDKWQKVNVIATKDSIFSDYTVFNEFTIEQKFVKEHWYSSKKPVISIKNENPHTQTLDTKSFSVKPNKSNKVKNFALGALIGAASCFLILK